MKSDKEQRIKVQDEKENSNRVLEEATKNIEEEIERKRSEDEWINFEGLVNVLKVSMTTSTKVVHQLMYLLFLFKPLMETFHLGDLFFKNYPKQRESNAINVFICVQQQYKKNSEEDMKAA